MRILTGAALPTLEHWRERHPLAHDHLGRLIRPRHDCRLEDTLAAGFPVGVDNEAYTDWSVPRFVPMIGRIEHAVFGRACTHLERTAPLGWPAAAGLPTPAPLPAWHPGLLFVTVPDVPFDARATARRWSEWAPLLSHLPLALCLQDGAGDVGIPWDWPNLRALFMAGSTDYKLSQEMADICREGKRRGLYIHCGRVNSQRRIQHLLRLQGLVDSIDGQCWDKWRNTHLPWGLQQVAQLVLE